MSRASVTISGLWGSGRYSVTPCAQARRRQIHSRSWFSRKFSIVAGLKPFGNSVRSSRARASSTGSAVAVSRCISIGPKRSATLRRLMLQDRQRNIALGSGRRSSISVSLRSLLFRRNWIERHGGARAGRDAFNAQKKVERSLRCSSGAPHPRPTGRSAGLGQWHETFATQQPATGESGAPACGAEPRRTPRGGAASRPARVIGQSRASQQLGTISLSQYSASGSGRRRRVRSSDAFGDRRRAACQCWRRSQLWPRRSPGVVLRRFIVWQIKEGRIEPQVAPAASA